MTRHRLSAILVLGLWPALPLAQQATDSVAPEGATALGAMALSEAATAATTAKRTGQPSRARHGCWPPPTRWR